MYLVLSEAETQLSQSDTHEVDLPTFRFKKVKGITF